MGGIDSARGYPAGDYLADSAIQTNFEITIPAFFIPLKIKLPFNSRPLRENVTPFIFFDYAYGMRRGGDEASPIRFMKSIGMGMKVKLLKSTMLRLAWGFPLNDATLNEASHSRFHLALDCEY